MATRTKAKRSSKQRQRYQAERPSTQPVHKDLTRGFSSIALMTTDILVNSDIARQEDKELAEQMLNDLHIYSCLQERMLATAQLDWQIVPEDEEDQLQVDEAETLTMLYRRMPNHQEFLMELLWATWRGTGVAELWWQWDDAIRYWTVGKHRPFSGDKIFWSTDGEPRIQDRMHQLGQRKFTKTERDRLLLHIYNPEDSAFEDSNQADAIMRGRGLRSRIWWFWWLKQNVHQFTVNLLERTSGGFLVGKYPMGNKEAMDAITGVLKNLGNNSRVTMPVPSNQEQREAYGIESVSLAGQQGVFDLFKTYMIDYLDSTIRRAICGSSMTAEAGPTGLGSNLADQHRATFVQRVNYDQSSLGDTLTNELLPRMRRFNMGERPWRPRFEFLFDEDSPDDVAKTIESAARAQIQVPRAWVYDKLKIPTPEEGEETVVLGAMDAGGVVEGVPGVPGATDADPKQSDQALNGAQITAAKEVIVDVTNGAIDAEVGKELLVAVGVERSRAERMVEAAQRFEPKAQASGIDVPEPSSNGAPDSESFQRFRRAFLNASSRYERPGNMIHIPLHGDGTIDQERLEKMLAERGVRQEKRPLVIHRIIRGLNGDGHESIESDGSRGSADA